MKQEHVIEMKSENIQLRNNVKDLQEQLQYSYKRIYALTKQHYECIRIISEIDVTQCNQEVFKDVVSSIDEGVSLKNQFPRVMSDLPDSKKFKFRD
tara:strand:- start:975 stop:1262 length:288 start_codon:yes stop_codon:yes gene_type:complete